VDELWQRYRTFWTPLLIGLGVFLIGVIVVHIMSDDPDTERIRLSSEVSKLGNMRVPARNTSGLLKSRGEALREENDDWSRRLNQTGDDQLGVVASAAEQALRAAVLRGYPAEPGESEPPLSARFDDDEVAAASAKRRFLKLLEEHKAQLSSDDPNVAFSRLLTAVWNDLRVRANRADVETSVERLGFGSISSVSRATLPGRVLNLALVARAVDVAIRSGMRSIKAVEVGQQIDPGGPEDFLVLLPVEMVMVGDMRAVRQVVDMLTDPAQPTPIEMARLAQPKRGSGTERGMVELTVKASSALVRPGVDLKLDTEEEE
jgi:hypothetical protein